ncbi:MAG: hypothetical protein VW874_08425, partial [Gammaproteobacteria bacterium]
MTHIVSSKLQNSVKTLSGAILATLILGACSATEAKPPIVKPGGIGQAPIELSKEEAVKIADSSYSQDDVKFMQDMIPHHHQA